VSGEDIEDLERQIEATRRALDQTLNALRLELSPRHQLEQAWHFAKDRSQRSLRAGARWASAHPTPVSLTAVALACGLYLGATRLLHRGDGRGVSLRRRSSAATLPH
jgi:hypothetical protein